MDMVRFFFSEYEKLAMRLLQCLYLTNPNMARMALKRENFEFNKLSSLEVASTSRSVLRARDVLMIVASLVMSHSEDFVGHTSVQEVFDVIWSGESAHKVMLRLSIERQSFDCRDLFPFRSKASISIGCLPHRLRPLDMRPRAYSTI